MFRENPFGNPDGARADLEEIETSFIVDAPHAIGKLPLPFSLDKRVIVGSKGTGKTVYLRKMQSLLDERSKNNPSIFVDDNIEQNLNCTDRVVKFCDLYPRHVLSEKWTVIWEKTILLTMANYFLCNSRLSTYISYEQKELLRNILMEFPFLQEDDLKYQYSPYLFFQILLSETETKHKADSLLDNKAWIRLKTILTTVLRTSPELYFFLDSIDLEYEHAPLHWLMCQKGLFYAVFLFLQENTWGSKLHLTITLRDNVFTSILRSEHSTKYSNESHIFSLFWDMYGIKHFLQEKVQKLEDDFFALKCRHSKDKTVGNWLGIEEIKNEFGKQEAIESFILRHTRLVPRDIIIIGNELAKARFESSLDKDEIIREIVFSHSRMIGEELITICAKNITANTMPQNAGVHKYVETFTANQFYHQSAYQKVLQVLKDIPENENQFDRHVLQHIEESAIIHFETDCFFLDVLWQNGAIGYIENNKEHFYAQKYNNDNLLPRDKDWYVFRACVAQKIRATR